MDVVIAVDSSTTATKALAFGPDGEVRAQGRSPIERSCPQPAWHEQDARQWWASTADALRQTTAQLAAAGDRPVAIGITHQRESFVCVDAADEPIRPAMLWLDARSGPQVRRLGTPEVHALSGKPPSTTPSFYKIAWMHEHEPDALAATRRIADVHAYLALKLTGRFATSTASADPTGLIDSATDTWSPRLIELCGARMDQMPELVTPGGVIGVISAEAAAATGLPEGLPVVAGGGDGQCAGLGAGVSGSGRGYLSLGTSITLGAHAEQAEPSRAYRILASPLSHGHTVEAFIASGALSVAWYRQAFPLADDDATPDTDPFEYSLQASPRGARGLRFLPYLSGSAAPYWDDASRGAFIGIDESHAHADFYRAVLEGLAYEIRVLSEGLEQATGELNEVIVMGGGAVSHAWLQIIADTLGRPLRLAGTAEATALGAAILAAHAVGLVEGNLDEVTAEMTRPVGTVQPDAEGVAIMASGYPSYRAVYEALRPIALSPLASDATTNEGQDAP